MINKAELQPGKELYRKLRQAIDARLKLSQDWMSKRYDRFSENEELFQAYIKTKDNDAVRAAKKKSTGEVEYVTIEVPYTYAIALTAHTYYTSVFLGRNPVFQVQGRHGETEQNIQSVEAVMDYQVNVGRMAMPLYVWLLDPLKYGMGFVGHYWDEEKVPVTKRVVTTPNIVGIPIPFAKTKEEYVTELVTGYAGNRLYNVRPQDAFPDPRVALWDFQRGEFFGRYTEITITELRAGETSGKYFNVDAALKRQKAGSGAGEDFDRDTGSSNATLLPDSGREWLPGMAPDDQPIGVLRGYELYLRLNPRQWGFSDSSTMEIWVFTVSKERVIIGAQPLGDASNAFPFDIIEHEPNGYASFSRSMMEISKPLNDIMTWLFNSHFYNVRAALNNMFVYDPSMISTEDMQDRRPGKLLRLTPMGYGRDINSMIKQFAATDITRSHVGDAQMVGDLIQRIFGVTDNVMGAVNPGGRKTATEIRTSTSLAVNRLKTQCEMMSAMGFYPLAQKLIARTQANLTQERQYRIVGDLANLGSSPWTQVGSDQIAGFYDYVPVDGTMPIDRFAQSALWQQLMGQAAQIPQIGMQYDFGKIFAWVASLAGAKNIQQFKLRVNVTDDAKMMAGAQAGNVVPLRPGEQDKPPQAQVPMMGASG